MHIDDIVNELMKENTPEFTKWTLNNTNENLQTEDKNYIDVHGVRILTMHIKNPDNSVLDFIIWIRLTTLKTETDETHEFWVQSVLSPTEAQKHVLESMKQEEILTMINNLNATYISGTLCYIDGYFAYIQKALLPKTNQMDHVKDVLMYAVSRGVPFTIGAINQFLDKTGSVLTNMSTIILNKLIDDYDKDHTYYLDSEETEDNAKFLLWFEKMMDTVCDHNNIVLFDIKDLQISNFMLKKLLDLFTNIKKKYPKVTYLFYNSTIIGDMVNDLYKNTIFKEFFKVFTKHKIDEMSDEEVKNLCIKYHEAVTTLVVSMMKRQDAVESNKE